MENFEKKITTFGLFVLAIWLVGVSVIGHVLYHFISKVW